MKLDNKLGKGKTVMTLLALVILLSLASITIAIPNTMTLQGKLTDASGTALTGTYNMSFVIYDAYTGGTAQYSLTDINVTTDSDGIYDIMLKDVNLDFSDQYYLGITVGTDDESTPRINLSTSPYAHRSNISEDLNPNNEYEVSVFNITGNLSVGTTGNDILEIKTQEFNVSDGNLNISGNLRLGDRIIFQLGEIIDNLNDNYLKITGNLNVTQSIISLGINLTAVDTSAADDWNLANYTAQNDSIEAELDLKQNIADGFDKENYSAEYSSTGYDIENFTANYQATGYDKENMTAHFIAHNTSLVEYIGFVNVSMKAYVDNEVSDVTFANNTDINVTRFVANNTLFVNDSRVGIGTNNPTTALTVIGDVNITGDLFVNDSSIYIGDKALSQDNGILKWGGQQLANANNNTVGGWTNVTVFSGNGTFTVPSGVTKIFVEVWGAGGGGGSDNNGNWYGPGGGGGGYSTEFLTVTPGQSFVVTVGTGGKSVTNDNGGDGEYSAFGTELNATGGKGGTDTWNIIGIGGMGYGGDINLRGGTSGAGVEYSGGFGGDSPLGGIGGAGQPQSGYPNNGSIPGGGGGGSISTSASGMGANGSVRIWFNDGSSVIRVDTGIFNESSNEVQLVDPNDIVGLGKEPNTEFKLDVAGKINATDINVTGTIEAERFVGDGSLLTGIDTSFQNGSDINVTNFVANNTLFVNGSMVGIGTSNPDSKFEVESNENNVQLVRMTAPSGSQSNDIVWIGSGADSSLYNLLSIDYGASYANNALTVRGDGNVGIGTSQPNALLHINGSTTNKLILTNGAVRSLTISHSNTVQDPWVFQTPDRFIFQVDAIDALTIDGAGDIGIRKHSSGFELDVNGTINASALNITGDAHFSNGINLGGEYRTSWPTGGGPSPFNSSGSNVYLNDSTANLGIGTGAPKQRLEVAGNVELTEATSWVNISGMMILRNGDDLVISD